MKALWKVLSVAVIATSLITVYALRAEKNSASSVVLDSFDQTTNANAQQLVADGRQIFRFDTFGDEDYWGGTLQLHKAIEGAKFGGVGPGVSPATAAAVGLKIDADALPASIVEAVKAGQVNLSDPAVTLALL
jgi:precorrin-4 methylase